MLQVAPGVIASQEVAAVVAPTLANFQTPIVTSTTATSANANATNIVAGVPHLVIIQWVQASGTPPTVGATLDGDAVSEIFDSEPPQNDVGIWIGSITPDSSGTLELAISHGSSFAAAVASIVQVNDFGSLGTPAEAYATASSYAAGYTTTVDGALLLGVLAVLGGDLAAFTPDATVPTVEVMDANSGNNSTSADLRGFIGTIAAATAGAHTWGASWGTSREFQRYAVEIKPA